MVSLTRVWLHVALRGVAAGPVTQNVIRVKGLSKPISFRMLPSSELAFLRRCAVDTRKLEPLSANNGPISTAHDGALAFNSRADGSSEELLLGAPIHQQDAYQPPISPSGSQGCKTNLFSRLPAVGKLGCPSFLRVPTFRGLSEAIRKTFRVVPQRQTRGAQEAAPEAVPRSGIWDCGMEQSPRGPIIEPGSEFEAYFREAVEEVRAARGRPWHSEDQDDDAPLIRKSEEELLFEARARDYLNQRLTAIQPEVEADLVAAQEAFAREGRIIMPRKFLLDSPE